MDQKTQFIADYLRADLLVHRALRPLTELSRETRLQIRCERYLEEGPAGAGGAIATTAHELRIETASARRRGAARASSPSSALGREEAAPAAGKRHPSWDLPARTTVFEILNRHGMVPKKRRRQRDRPSGPARRARCLAPERPVVRGLQGVVSVRRRPALRSSDDQRRREPLPDPLPRR